MGLEGASVEDGRFVVQKRGDSRGGGYIFEGSAKPIGMAERLYISYEGNRK